MILKLKTLDKFVLFLLSYVVLIDMINGFFMIEMSKVPISQIFKTLILITLFLRLSKSKYFSFIILLFIAFQIGAVLGFIKTGSFDGLINDVVVSTKWFNVPLSFFYFKILFNKTKLDSSIPPKIYNFLKMSFIFLAINMILGMLGYGMAFYNEGYNNAIGTRGYIFAGNELTILLLAISFPLATNFYLNKEFKKYFLLFIVIMVFAFLMTSKTVLGGVIIVFLIPPISQCKFVIKKKWIDYFLLLLIFGLPVLSYTFFLGITKMGLIDKLKFAMRRNNNELLTVILSNRNNFIKRGWDVFVNDYDWYERIFGLGQKYHLELSGHLAEVDFFSLMFSSGIFGLSCLLVMIFYWLYRAYKLSQKGNLYAKAVFIFIIFITIISNLSGHIYGSGIAGYFIGLCLALMYFEKHKIEANE